MKTKRVAAVIFLVTLASACSLDYNQTTYSEELAANTPDSILNQFSYTSVQKGVPVFKLKAVKAEIYDKKNETQLEGVSFTEYADDGTVASTGTADTAVYYTDTKNAELSGNIKVHSLTENATVTTDYLYWNDAQKTLTGKPSGVVAISRDNGTHVRGTGFEAEAQTKSFSFSGPVTGVYVQDNANNSGN